MKKKYITIPLLVIVLVGLCAGLVIWRQSEGGLDRDYLDDICIQLEGRDGELVIREWSFLMGSGADIYYSQNGRTTLLGQVACGDDGYCPFEDGKYSMTQDGNSVIIKWLFLSGGETWRTETFTLPVK